MVVVYKIKDYEYVFSFSLMQNYIENVNSMIIVTKEKIDCHKLWLKLVKVLQFINIHSKYSGV